MVIRKMAMRIAISAAVVNAPFPLDDWHTVLRCVIYSKSGDDRYRRRGLEPGGKPRGAELVKSAQIKSANRTNYAALPLAA